MLQIYIRYKSTLHPLPNTTFYHSCRLRVYFHRRILQEAHNFTYLMKFYVASKTGAQLAFAILSAQPGFYFSYMGTMWHMFHRRVTRGFPKVDGRYFPLFSADALRYYLSLFGGGGGCRWLGSRQGKSLDRNNRKKFFLHLFSTAGENWGGGGANFFFQFSIYAKWRCALEGRTWSV